MQLTFIECLLCTRHWAYGTSFNHRNNSTRALDWPKIILDVRVSMALVFSLPTLSIASHP